MNNIHEEMKKLEDKLMEQSKKELEQKKEELTKLQNDIEKLMWLADKHLLMVSTSNNDIRKLVDNSQTLKFYNYKSWGLTSNKWAICGKDMILFALQYEPKNSWEKKISFNKNTFSVNGIEFTLVEKYLQDANNDYVKYQRKLNEKVKEVEAYLKNCEELKQNIEQIKGLVNFEDFDMYKDWEKERTEY